MRNGLPDLMLIDGGRQHLAVVEKAMEQLGVTVPAVAIAKPDDRLFVTWKEDPYICRRGCRKPILQV